MSKLGSTARKAVANSIGKLLVEHLRVHVFGEDIERTESHLSLSSAVVQCPWWEDIPEICEHAGLDLGIVVRDARNQEVTLWPEINFTSKVSRLEPAEKKKRSHP